MSDNLKLWDAVCRTNPADTKKVTFGRAITAIDPYKQVRSATEQFGAAGAGWGWEVKDTVILPTNEIGILIRLWHGDPNKYIEQWGQSSFYIDNAEKKKDTDCFKKATTDGVTKCLSYLGFNADIFLGKYDDNKYVQEMVKEFKEENTPKDIQEVIDTRMRLANNDFQWVNDNWEGAVKKAWGHLSKEETEKLNNIGSR